MEGCRAFISEGTLFHLDKGNGQGNHRKENRPFMSKHVGASLGRVALPARCGAGHPRADRQVGLLEGDVNGAGLRLCRRASRLNQGGDLWTGASVFN